MLMHPDHVTIVVTDLQESLKFFQLLNFELEVTDLISGEKISKYLQVEDVEADHLTLVLKNSNPRFEIQLLHYRNPTVRSDPSILNLARPGYNHLCFTVDDIQKTLNFLTENGIRARGEILEYQKRKLVYIEGPEYITIELAEWL
ncbi:VOC family protein [Microbulbifer sp. GL-2]|uniref:VOC family protein n=1 Tax=Microbulbifer sp. GL-2 TaxID=2591606 RepID=UPI0011633007|nr:VOC family protein [Microbulbifer sp. GL-2]BBM01317.1 glyoxalase [Microbulbifer sp. GL-2]